MAISSRLIPIAAFWVTAFVGLHGCSFRDVAPPAVESFDAGGVFASETPQIVHTFKISNPSGRVLTLLGETHSCTCTKVEIERMTVPPHSEGSVTMKVKVPYNYGALTVACTIDTDDPRQARRSFNLHYTSYVKVRVVPERMDLGDFPIGESASEVASRMRHGLVETYARIGQPAPMPKLDEIPPGFRVELEEAESEDELPGGVIRRRHRLSLAVNPSAAGDSPGPKSQEIRVAVEGAGPAQLIAQWRRSAPFQCVPSSIHFGFVESNAKTPKPAQIRITSPSGKPFRILSVATNSRAVRAKTSGGAATDRSANHHSIQFEFDPAAMGEPRSVTGQVVIETDDDRVPSFKIPWSAFMRRKG